MLVDEKEDDHGIPSDITEIGEPYTKQNFGNVVFPLSNGRRFQKSWMDKHPWVEYSVQKDAVYCYPCRQFPSASVAKNPDITFTITGFRNWQAATQTAKGLSRHENCEQHKSAVKMMKEKEVRQIGQSEVSQLLSANVLNIRRYYVKSILDVVVFLAANELAFRGNWDAETKNETGLFRSLFEFAKEKDEKLQQAIQLIPKNATYTSPEIQNQLIESAVHCTLKAIVDRINASEYFTLFVDGTKDKVGVECISIAARYIVNGKPVESVIALERCDDLTAHGVATIVIETLEKCGVNTEKLLCQCYDGAFVMSGHLGGVQTILSQHYGRHIPYVHCFSHRLHLVVVDMVKEIKCINWFFDQAKMIYKFFRLYKVRNLYEGTSLKKLIDTRWEGHLKSTSAICENYKSIVECLQEITKENANHGIGGEDIAKAVGILACITKPQFVYSMVFMKELLEIIKPADKALQSREIGYSDASPFITVALNKITLLDTDENFSAIEEKAINLISSLEALPKPYETRSCSLDDYQTEEKDKFKSAYIQTLNMVSTEIKRRFTENDEILRALSRANEMDLKLLEPLASLHRIKMPSESDFNIAMDYLRERGQTDGEIKSILERLFPIRNICEDVYR